MRKQKAGKRSGKRMRSRRTKGIEKHSHHSEPEPMSSTPPGALQPQPQTAPLQTPVVPQASPFASLFQAPPKSLTRENLAKTFVDEEDYEFKTEIINPFAMSALDTFALWLSGGPHVREMLKQYGIFETHEGRVTSDVLLRYYAARLRINFISRNRLSRTELGNALRQIEFAEDKDKGKKLLEGLFSNQ